MGRLWGLLGGEFHRGGRCDEQPSATPEEVVPVLTLLVSFENKSWRPSGFSGDEQGKHRLGWTVDEEAFGCLGPQTATEVC